MNLPNARTELLTLEQAQESDDRVWRSTVETARYAGYAILYAFALLMLDITVLKSVLLGLLVFACLLFQLGRATILRFGLVFIPYAAGVWIGLLPPLSAMPGAICAFSEQFSARSPLR